MSSLKVTVLKCDKCGAEGDPGTGWATVSIPIPRQPGSKRRQRTNHICPECTPVFVRWLNERAASAVDPEEDIKLAEWLAGDPKERKAV